MTMEMQSSFDKDAFVGSGCSIRITESAKWRKKLSKIFPTISKIHQEGTKR